MKAITRRILAVVVFSILSLGTLSAGVSLSSISGKTGFGRFFQMAFSGSQRAGIVVDGIKAGLDAILDFGEDNCVALQANATAAANNGSSVMTFSASLRKEAEVSEDLSLFVDTGVETHLILHTGVSTELGIACTGGAAFQVADGMSVVLSGGLSDMFFSTAVKTIYGSAQGSVATVGMKASLECRYTF